MMIDITDKNQLLYKHLMDDLVRHEGNRAKIYRCTAGYKTVGIGHKLVFLDFPFNRFPVGAKIPFYNRNLWFWKDTKKAIKDCTALFVRWDKLPFEVKLILANMAFNLGRKKLKKFKKLIAAIDSSTLR